MRRLTTLAAAAVLACLGWSSPLLAKGPFGSISFGNWRGGAFTNDKSGAFSHCSASAKYKSGVTLLVIQTANGPWMFGFAKPEWQLTLGETFPLEITLDGQAQYHLFGTVISPQLFSAVVPAPAVQQLARSNLLVAVAHGQTYQFSYAFMGRLMTMIHNCMIKVKAEGIASAGDFSLAGPNPPATQGAAPGAAGAPGPAQPGKIVDMSGTGFVVSPNGYVITNNHVVSNCVGDIHGNLASGPVMTLRLASSDHLNDLALLQAPGSFPDPAVIRSTPVHSGEGVIAVGYPYHGLLTSDLTVTTGTISSLSGILNDTRYLQVSAPIQPGNSGGPLLDTSGAIVGVAAAKFNALKFAQLSGGNIPENVNFGIKTGALRDFLDNSAVPYKTSEPSAVELKTEEVATKARAFTMLISCKARETAQK